MNDFLTEYTTPEFVKAYNVYINNLNDKDSIFYSNKKDIILEKTGNSWKSKEYEKMLNKMK